MKSDTVENMEIRDWKKNHAVVARITGKIHWLADLESCLVESGTIQFSAKPLKRYATNNLCVDETVGGKIYCLFYR